MVVPSSESGVVGGSLSGDSPETNRSRSSASDKLGAAGGGTALQQYADNGVVGVHQHHRDDSNDEGNDQDHEDMIVHTLGTALAGVTMGGGSGGGGSAAADAGSTGRGGGGGGNSGGNAYSSSSPTPMSTPFGSGLGGGGSVAAAAREPESPILRRHDSGSGGSGWGNFVAESGNVFASSSSSDPARSRTPSGDNNNSSVARAAGTGGGGGGCGGPGRSGSAEGMEMFMSHSGGASQQPAHNATTNSLAEAVFRYSQQNLASLGGSNNAADDAAAAASAASVASASGGNDSGGAFHLQGLSATAGGSTTPTPFVDHLRGGGGTSQQQQQSQQDSTPTLRRRTESPSCSVTGTTTSSRSCSPYTNASADNVGGGRVIHAYHHQQQQQRYDSNANSNSAPPNDVGGGHHHLAAIGRGGGGGGGGSGSNQPSFADDDRSSSGYLSHGHGSHPSLATLDSATNIKCASPYSKDRAAANSSSYKGSSSAPQIVGSPFDPPDQHQHQQNSRSSPYVSLHSEGNAVASSPQQHQQQQVPPQQPTPTAAAGGQPQVLYMAVPSPDGRGQVLQPVQMVQLPGKPNYFVAAGAPPPTQQHQVPSPSVGGDNGQQANSMMVLPPLPGGGSSHPGSLDGSYPPSPMPHQQQDATSGSTSSSSRMQQTPMENRSRVAQYAIDTSANRGTGSPYSSGGGNIDRSSSVPTTPRGGNADDYGSATNSVASNGGGGAGGPGGSSPYQVDSAVSSLYSSPQRPPLDALLGEVRRLSRDQVGCRLVQQALDEEGPMAATLILNEGLPFWAEAMVDPFGNYLFQKILEKVTPQERVMLVKTVGPRLVNASLNLHGTRSVQKVVEMCSIDEQNGHIDGVEESAADILTKALSPAAARLCIDSHGNHVIQRILLKLGPKHTKFVFDAVAASVGDVARHRHGCCVIQRCLDSPPNEARSHLVLRIVEKSLELMQDAYGNYVVQYVLDVCSDEDVHAVCESVAGKVNLLAIQKFSSNVMEKCLERCSDRVKEMYLNEMSDPDRIRELMMDPFGNYVVQRALSVATHQQAVRLVEAMRPHLTATQTQGPHGQRNGGVRNTAGGRRIIAKICRRFPNFTLTAVGSDEIYTSKSHHHNHHHQQHHHHHAARQQQQHHHHHHHPQHHPPGPAAMTMPAAPGGYSTIVGPPANTLIGSQLSYGADPRLAPGHVAAVPHQQQQQQQQVQQQSYYSLGGGTPYYEQYNTNGGLGGFPGMEF